MDKRMAKQAKKYVATTAAYQKVFKSPEGELVLMDLMKTHGILRHSFEGDVNKLLFKEGERNVVLRILEILKVNVESLYERIDRETQDME